MRNLRNMTFFLGLILIVVFNANASNSGNEMNRNEEDGAVYYKIKSQSGKEYITKYLNFGAEEMVKIYDVSPEETDRILGKSSVRRHLRILEIKKGLRLYSLSELLDLYKIAMLSGKTGI